MFSLSLIKRELRLRFFFDVGDVFQGNLQSCTSMYPAFCFPSAAVNLDRETNVPFHGRNQGNRAISSVMRQLNKQS